MVPAYRTKTINANFNVANDNHFEDIRLAA